MVVGHFMVAVGIEEGDRRVLEATPIPTSSIDLEESLKASVVNDDFAARADAGETLHQADRSNVGVPADVAHQMLVPIGDVFAEQFQPLGAGHHLEVPLEARVRQDKPARDAAMRRCAGRAWNTVTRWQRSRGKRGYTTRQ
jgi:hypothetical protein